MSQQNIDLIKTVYSHFNDREYYQIIPYFADDMTWHAANNSPLADESPYHGPTVIRERVFGRIDAAFEVLTIRADEMFAADDGRVVVLGYYISKLRGKTDTGEIQLAHIWTARDGKLVKFQQYIDTYTVAMAMK